MFSRLCSGLCLLLLTFSFSASALGTEPGAQSAPAKPATAPAAAAEHVRRGDQARRAGRWAEAAAAYQDALKAAAQEAAPPEKRAAILGELGLCELAQGKHRDAAEHLDRAMQHRDALPPDQRRRFEQGQKKAEREVGMLFIGTNPPDAEVFLDGKPMERSEPTYLVFVEPGKHTVRARLKGYEDAAASVDVTRGGWPSVWLYLPRSAAPAAQANVNARRAPAAAPATPSSSKAATYRKAGVIAASGGVVLGFAFMASGIVLDAQIEERSSALANKGGNLGVCKEAAFKDECADLHALIRTRNAFDGVALGSFIASGVIGAVTLSSLWWAPGDRDRAPIQVVPMATSKHAGAILRGAW